ncbi:MAG: BON domain-containing protein [Terriglobales bacterium]
MSRTARVGMVLGCMLLGASLMAAQNAQNPKVAERKALDASIQSYLQKEFAGKQQLTNVHNRVDDRVVTLTGSVGNLRAKLQAEQDASQVQSVDGVINRIQVNTIAVPDGQLQRTIADRLVYDRIGQGQTFNSLTLKVHNGKVTVGGSVIDYPSRDSAVDIIVATKGVKGVVDSIQVEPLSPMDDQIRMAAARAIYGNPQFTRYANDPAHSIRIVVKNGHVTLQGVVDSQVDKVAAGNAVRRIPDVFSVTNELAVASGG